MMMDVKFWLPVLGLAGAFLALFALAEWLYHSSPKGLAERTRKLVHVGTGLLTMLFPWWLHSIWQVAALCGSFFVLLRASQRLGLLPSINAVERRTVGSLLYPVSVLVSFGFYEFMGDQEGRLLAPFAFFYLPVLLMAIPDPIAATVGQAWRRHHPLAAPGKTWAGSGAFFASALVISLGLGFMFNVGLSGTGLVALVVTLAATTTLAERLSQHGWDNLTIPATVMACLCAAHWLADGATRHHI